jgi:two-component system chemotaxis response regulator CheY
MIGRFLKELRFETLEAGNGREALERLQQTGAADLALVDWNMPEMNGLEFVRAVRAEASYNGMLLLMITTETEIQNVSAALEAGANEYIMKPFSKDMIAEKISILGIPAS